MVAVTMSAPSLNDDQLVEKMTRAAYVTWHRHLNAPRYADASLMVKAKFRRLVEAMLLVELGTPVEEDEC
jgi:hypothetical protein